MAFGNRKAKVKQHDITDCGAACLASVAGYYNLELPIARIRQIASTDKKGTNARGMIEAAETLGFSAKGARGEMASLFKIPTPTIAHVEIKNILNHYVVIYNVTKKYIKVMDPMDGKFHQLSHEEFKEQWSGVLILLMPDEHFKEGNEKASIISRLWFLMKPHKGILLQTLFGAAVFTLLGLSSAIFVQLIIDNVIADANRNLLNLLGIGMIVLLVLQTFIGATKTVFILKTGQLIDARLILGYYKHLVRLPQRFFDSMRVGEIISRIGDAVKIRAFINNASITLSVNIFIVLFSFGLMFTYYWKLGLVMLCIIPCYIIIYYITNKINKKTQREVMESSADLEAQLVESLTSVSTIKQFGLEDYANIKTETRFVTLLKRVYTSGLNSVFSDSSSNFVARLFTIILLWVGAAYVLEGYITTGELMSFYAIIGYFTGPVQSLVTLNKVIQDASIAADRLFEIMDLEKEDNENQIELTPEMLGDIRFEHVKFRYGSRVTVFEDLNLTIPEGKMTAFVGESGSGKTTIVNILQKLYPLHSGKVHIGDVSLNYIDNESLRSTIATVPQNIDLFAGNVIDNIAVGEFEPDMERIIAICKQLGIIEFIENLPHGFKSYLGEHGSQLSGGQKQRIAIARALYKEPEILILDEATSSLDSASEEHVQNTINFLKKENKTIILIAHRLSTVYTADKICVLDNGKFIEEGSHKELMEKEGAYFGLWQRQLPFKSAEQLVNKS